MFPEEDRKRIETLGRALYKAAYECDSEIFEGSTRQAFLLFSVAEDDSGIKSMATVVLDGSDMEAAGQVTAMKFPKSNEELEAAAQAIQKMSCSGLAVLTAKFNGVDRLFNDAVEQALGVMHAAESKVKSGTI